MATHLEVERKYTVDDGAVPPDLRGIGPVEDAEPVQLEATYFDTADRALLRARIALRRRTGGADAGWHVKLPAALGRTEVQQPIDASHPDRLPDALSVLLRPRLRGRGVEPLAIVRTTRTARTVRDGAAAVEVVDDLVTGSDVRAGTLRRWREWEAEAVGGDEAASVALLDRVEPVLAAAGARPSASPAKLAQTLGLPAPAAPARPRTAGELVERAVAGLVERLLRDEAALEDGGAEAVHAMRKTVRRLRAVLSVRGVEGPRAAELRARLKEVGRVLGEARDRDVAADTAAALLQDLPAGTPGAAGAWRVLVDGERATAREVGSAALDWLGAPRHFALLDALDAFRAEGRAASERPKPVLRAAMAHAAKRARRHAARRLDDLDALHDARRAARRFELLVAALAAEGVAADPAVRRAAAAAAVVHDALGAHRDIALLDAALPAASMRLAADGGNAFAIGAIAERGRVRAAAAERDGRRALAAFVRAARRV